MTTLTTLDVMGRGRSTTGAEPYKTTSVLYGSSMTIMSASAARERLPEAIEAARTEAVLLERYGRTVAVLVSPERYDQMMDALEDAEDVELFDEAIAEGGPTIPWEQVKADLGWA
jgi:antitoxin Phd